MKWFGVYKILKCCTRSNIKCLKKQNNLVAPVDNNSDNINNTTTDNNNNNTRQTVDVKKATVRRHSGLRLQKVITEISSYQNKDLKELKDNIKLQAKSLLKFFSMFVFYACVGGLLFFYVEECADLSTAGDNSIPATKDTYLSVQFNNLTASCLLLYNAVYSSNTTSTLGTSNSVFNFTSFCIDIFKQSTPGCVVKGQEKHCVWDEFQLLKYVEYTIFTLLTIGYGNTTPITILGRSLAIIYSIIGVPIAVTMYSVAGKLLVIIFTYVVKCVNRKIMQKKFTEKTVKLQVLFVCILCMIIIMLIGCAITTRKEMENWEFSSSVYFWFISLTTIGYGDLHFDRNRHLANPHLLLLAASLLLFGLGMVAAVIESFSLALEKSDIIGDDGDDDGESDSEATFMHNNPGTLDLVISTVKSGAGIILEETQELKKRKPSLRKPRPNEKQQEQPDIVVTEFLEDEIDD